MRLDNQTYGLAPVFLTRCEDGRPSKWGRVAIRTAFVCARRLLTVLGLRCYMSLGLMSHGPLRLGIHIFATTLLSCLVSHAEAPRGAGFGGGVPLAGTTLHALSHATDEGQAADDMILRGVTVDVGMSSQQMVDMQALLKQQQSPASPLYHHWLLPDAFAKRFGPSADRVNAIKQWLLSQGAEDITSESYGKGISFSAPVSRINQIFGTQMHTYRLRDTIISANATPLKVPQDLAPLITSVRHLTTFRLTSRIEYQHLSASAITPQTTLASLPVMTPARIASVYDMAPLYAAGLDGNAQSLAIVGQSNIHTLDLSRFQKLTNSPSRFPTMLLVPGSGDPIFVPGDELESDIDLEYALALAPAANVSFVYTGDNRAYGVFDALAYAIQLDIASVISISYGTCETDLSPGDHQALESLLLQANVQGQTIVAASGDHGATACDNDDRYGEASYQGLAVSYPASSEYVTAVGGSMFLPVEVGSDQIAPSMPADPAFKEVAWNEALSSGEVAAGSAPSLAGGGGASSLTQRPNWQVALGLPEDNRRYVPDVSLDAAAFHYGYIFCSSDLTLDGQAYCADISSGTPAALASLAVGGGTSFAAPIFAAIITLSSQLAVGTEGKQGNINPALYAMYADDPLRFHDITVGDNEELCREGSLDCPESGRVGFTTNAYYDPATGLGSPDATSIASGLQIVASKGLKTTMTLSSSLKCGTSACAVSATVRIVAQDGTPIQSGSLTLTLDVSSQTGTIGVLDGSGSFTFPSVQSGAHVISVVYQGNLLHQSSTESMSVLVPQLGAPERLDLSVVGITRSDSSLQTAQVVITSSNYEGPVNLVLATADPALLADACYVASPITIGQGQTVQTIITIILDVSGCKTGMSKLQAAASGSSQAALLPKNKPPVTSQDSSPDRAKRSAAMALIGLALLRRKRSIRAAYRIAALAFAVFSVSLTQGCAVHPASLSTNVPRGTYAATLGVQESAVRVNAPPIIQIVVP